MPKSVYNLLSKTTSTPIEYASSNSTGNLMPIIVHNDHAKSGRVYLEVNGFYITAGADTFTPQFYTSFNGYTWFLMDTGDPGPLSGNNSSNFEPISTGGSFTYDINDVGWYFRFAFHNTTTVSAVRAHIVLNDVVGF